MWQPLFANLAIVAMMLVAWNSAGDSLSRLPRVFQHSLLGIVMAAGTVGSMMMAYEVTPGVYYDLRTSIIAVSGFFGGIPGALITAGAALLYRIYLGGAVAPGAIGIALAAAIGLAGFSYRRAGAIRRSDILGLALLVASSSLLVVFTLPAASRSALMPDVTAPLLLSFVSTALLGTVLLNETRRRELAASNLQYRSMVDALPDCLNVKDAEGRFLAANPATATLMRASSARDLIGRTDFDFYPQDLAMRFRADEISIMQSGEHATIEQAGRLPDGSAGWLLTLKAPMVDEDGRIVGLITHNRDITVQKELQAKLAETQSHLDRALEHMNDGLAMFDPDGVILFCNNRYRELFPRTSHLRAAGARFEDILRAAIETGEEHIGKHKSLNEYIAERMDALRLDGERLIELADGRIFSARTKVLPNGCTLRMMADVTERKNFERELEYQATHDSLTGLPNRAYFNSTLAELLVSSRTDDSDLVVMLLDLDRFKEVNDTFGHAVGDKLLVEVARRLQKSIRRGDIAVRLGGDEFAILALGQTDGTGDAGLAARIMKNLTRPLSLGDVTLLPGGTIGYTVHPADSSDAEGLLTNADKALYRAKARGRGTWEKYDPRADVSRISARA